MTRERPERRLRRFSRLRVDTSTHHGKQAQRCLRALYDALLADVDHLLTPADRAEVQDAALAQARLNMMQERENAGTVSTVDVIAAQHIARKAKRTVERIARRLRAQGRRR